MHKAIRSVAILIINSYIFTWYVTHVSHDAWWFVPTGIWIALATIISLVVAVYNVDLVIEKKFPKKVSQ